MIQVIKDLGLKYLSPNAKRKRRFVLCKCHCGNEFEVRRDHINKVKSCGCNKNQTRKEVPIGETFGRLTITEDLGIREYGGERVRFVEVTCSCGSGKYEKPLKVIQKGDIQSCGCLRKETMSEIGKQNKTHGQEGTRLYKIWDGMKYRCSNPNAEGYEYYGGKGVKVCQEWQDFQPFYDWARANGYEEGLTIDRVDPDGDYEPTNCQWLTKSANSKKMHEDRKRRGNR